MKPWKRDACHDLGLVDKSNCASDVDRREKDFTETVDE